MSAATPFIPRAPRYRIAIPLRFRAAGDSTWLDGYSENISRTGLLFRADQTLVADTFIEMMLEMPAEVTAAGGVHVRRGHVVRAVPPSPREHQPGYTAASFDTNYTHPDDPRRI